MCSFPFFTLSLSRAPADVAHDSLFRPGVSPTCAVSLVPGPQQRAGLLVLALLPLPLVLAVVGEGVNALVAAGVAVRVVDDHVVGRNRQVNPQLVTGQASLRLRAEQRRAEESDCGVQQDPLR